MSLPPGTVFAGFTIERLLGAGGMGAVYLAAHPRLERRIALKVLTDTFTIDPKTRAAFDREANLAAALDHPNIVPVFDRSGAADPALWLAMRYINGGDAAALLSDNPGGLDPVRAVRLITDAAHALDHAHAQGVLHRDVKPANLLIETDSGRERAVLTDFGIARTLDDTVTLSGIAATFAYAAPERFSDIPADHRADIYSLGCTLFQLLTGRQPFARKDQAAVIAAHLTAAPPAPSALRTDLPPGLDDVIATALAKSPGDRYPSCTALAEAARAALPPAPPEPVGPVQVSLIEPPPRAAEPPILHAVTALPSTTAGDSGRRRLTVVSGVLLAGIGILAGTAFTLRGNSAAPDPAPSSPPSVVVTQPITTTTSPSPTITAEPSPIDVPPPADTPAPDTYEPPPVQRRQTTAAVAPQPQNPVTQAPQVVPQTRTHQFGG